MYLIPSLPITHPSCDKSLKWSIAKTNGHFQIFIMIITFSWFKIEPAQCLEQSI